MSTLKKMNALENNSHEIEKFEWKLQIEAALFMHSQIISIDEISVGLRNIPKKVILPLVLDLMQDYQNFNSALEIIQVNAKSFKFQIKSDIIQEKPVTRFTEGQDLKLIEIKTIAFILYNEPIEIQDVQDFVGKGAKRALNKLKKMGFLTETKKEYWILDEERDEKPINAKVYKTTDVLCKYLGVNGSKQDLKNHLQQYIDEHS